MEASSSFVVISPKWKLKVPVLMSMSQAAEDFPHWDLEN